jgi:hypothetical protein
MRGPLIVGTTLHPEIVQAMSRITDAPILLEKPMETQTETKPSVVNDELQAPKIEQIKPNRSCRHCLGRGHVGTNTATGKKVLCRCVRRSYDQALRAYNTEKSRLAKLAPVPVSASAGWDEPKAPVGNTEALAAA